MANHYSTPNQVRFTQPLAASNKERRLNAQPTCQSAAIRSITESLACSSQKDHSPLSETDEEKTRQYYLTIANDQRLNFKQKKKKIWDDLGQELKLLFNDKAPLPDKISYGRTDTGLITELRDNVLTVGRLSENDISIHIDQVSRIHAFIFVFKTYILVLDSWSVFGTECKILSSATPINGEKSEVKMSHYQSLPGKRRLIKVEYQDQVQLSIPHCSVKIIFNPKPCIACYQRIRNVKLNCGHSILCKECYRTMQSDSSHKIDCPICRKKVSKETSSYLPHTFCLKTEGAIINHSESPEKKRRVVIIDTELDAQHLAHELDEHGSNFNGNFSLDPPSSPLA